MTDSKKNGIIRKNYLKKTIFNAISGLLAISGLVILIGSAGKNDALGVAYPMDQLIKDCAIGLSLIFGSLFFRG
jgi:hypothetical protein